MRVIWIILIEAAILIAGAATYHYCGNLPSFRSSGGATASARVVTIPAAGSSMDGTPFEDAITPIDWEPRLEIRFSEEKSRFGFLCKHEKRLTGHTRGESNDTSLRIDRNDFHFGHVSNGTSEFSKEKDDRTGKIFEWRQREVSEGNSKKWVTKMEYKEFKVIVTEEVSLVIGDTTRLYDTALVKYVIENRDKQPHRVGLRFLLDTCIGDDDGVPFEVGPSELVKEVSIVDTLAVYQRHRIPEYLLPLENANDLCSAGSTHAVVGLKLRDFPPIDKVVLCRPPRGEPAWEWRFEPINADPEQPDSCVVLYWSELRLAPGGRRVCGFTYGLDRAAR